MFMYSTNTSVPDGGLMKAIEEAEATQFHVYLDTRYST